MINDEFIGHEWTNAILGLRAKEIHLCGDGRAQELVKNILKETHDRLVVHYSS